MLVTVTLRVAFDGFQPMVNKVGSAPTFQSSLANERPPHFEPLLFAPTRYVILGPLFVD